jgi:tRNA dimethylallyltransferase
VVVGGSGLYFRALFRGLFEGPARDEALRARLVRLAQRFGDARLHRLLQERDPESARRIALRDRVRIVRALEVLWSTGRPISSHHQAPLRGLSGLDVLAVGLRPDRTALREAVVARSRAMLAGGLLEETRHLLARGLAPDAGPLKAIGYRQAVALLAGRISEEAAMSSLVTDTMRYAKRQMTWFRREPIVRWVDVPEEAEVLIRGWLGLPPARVSGT